VRQFFTTMGVDLNPPKSVFFNDREGTILVRATLQDLDTIEAAVQVLNLAPPQVHIKAKFVEVSQTDSKALGFDYFLGNTLMANGSIGAQGGTAPSFAGRPTAANPLGTFPGSVIGGTAIAPSATDQLVTKGLRNQTGVLNPNPVPTLFTLTGILTDPQFRVVIHALEQRDGVDLLSESSVTTMSGRQTQVQTVDLRQIVTEATQNTTTASGGGNAGGNAAATAQIGYTTQSFPLGPTLDVVPYVSADGFTIQMTIIPTIVEFLGYDDPGAFVPTTLLQASGTSSATGTLPLPHFRLRQVTTSAIVWDGQTVVLGGLIAETVAKIKDKVPMLGDLPYVGRFFRSESSQASKANLMIFVTPTIIDPAGNRFHSEDEMPFAQTGVPHQPAATAGQ
jgi:general secretion pathway protein D